MTGSGDTHALRGLKLRRLALHPGQPTTMMIDLGPLKGMPLKNVYVWDSSAFR